MTTGIEPHIAKSLTDAGIGVSYHNSRLLEHGDEGGQLHTFLGKHGNRVREGKSLILRDFKRASVIMLARAFHINGVGVRCVSVSRLWTLMQRIGSEEWEDVEDAVALFLMPAECDRPNPLNNWQRDAVEDYLTRRMEAGRPVVFHMADLHGQEPWWTEEFMAVARECGMTVRAGDKK